MRAFLRAAIVGAMVGTFGCATPPPAAAEEPAECPADPLELPLNMIVLVYPKWEHWNGEEPGIAYLLLIGKTSIQTIDGIAYRASPGLQDLVAEYDTWNSPIPVRRITLDVARKESI